MMDRYTCNVYIKFPTIRKKNITEKKLNKLSKCIQDARDIINSLFCIEQKKKYERWVHKRSLNRLPKAEQLF